jgi:hypothetical protein
VQHAGRDQLIAGTSVPEQASDLERVQDERGAIGLPPLAVVAQLGVGESSTSLWKLGTEWCEVALGRHGRRV